MIDLKKGDCLELLKDIPDKSVDLVIIDPPYELETQRGGGFFRESNEKRRKYQDEIENMMAGITEELLDIICKKIKKLICIYFVVELKC
jgi:DNA modification methylase